LAKRERGTGSSTSTKDAVERGKKRPGYSVRYKGKSEWEVTEKSAVSKELPWQGPTRGGSGEKKGRFFIWGGKGDSGKRLRKIKRTN